MFMLGSSAGARIGGNLILIMSSSPRVLVWDLPVRLLHFVLAVSVVAAAGLALACDDDHPLFVYHAWFGLLAGGALGLRLVIGLVGSRHARFASWNLGLRALGGYLLSLVRGEPGRRLAGHNPAAAWVMLGLLALTAAAVVTGIAGGEDLHEVAAYALLVLVGLHLAGLVWHTVRHRENIALAMVDGRKVAPPEAALRHASPWLGAAVALVLAGWCALLVRGFDPAAGTLRLPLLSQPINLLEEAEEGHRGPDARHHSGHRDDD